MTEKSNNISRIQSLINDIESEFEDQKIEIEKSISKIKSEIKHEKIEIKNLNTKLSKKYDTLKDQYNKILEDRNYYLDLVRSENNDIEQIEKENIKLKNQIEKQELINQDLSNDLDDKKTMMLDLKKKIDTITKTNQKKEYKLQTRVDEFKKYLGIFFQVTDNNKIKIIFDKLCKDESFECYAIIDLNDGYTIVDVYPKICSIERFTCLLKDKTKFFDLVQLIRYEFVREFCK